MVSTIEGVLEMRRHKEQWQELTDADRIRLGKDKRIPVPIADLRPHHMKELAEKLRGVANQLDFMATNHETPLRHRLTDLAYSIEDIKRWVKENFSRYAR